jgi:hypothetical protein
MHYLLAGQWAHFQPQFYRGKVSPHCDNKEHAERILLGKLMVKGHLGGHSSSQLYTAVHFLAIMKHHFCQSYSGGLMVSMLAIKPKILGFIPSQGQWIFKGNKNL